MQQELTPEIMYEASCRKDASFEGLFFMAVKTTGIFCRPACTARKPKFQNVAFFTEAKDALLNGYRPCKVCKPLQQKGETPAYISTLLADLQRDPALRLKDWDLRQRGVEPATLRRWFKQHYGMTFQSYQRFLRINRAFGQIRYGDKITTTAFDNGFESLSGFGESFRKLTGHTPQQSKSQQLVTITRITTPVGPMIAGATDEGICLFDFAERRMMESIMKRIEQGLNAKLIPGDHPHFKVLNEQMQEYFTGQRREFDLPLHIIGTEFQQKVWRGLQQIAYGTTKSYKGQSIFLGNEKAIRAVARANGENGIAIIIPCHRVIGENGHLTGYGGGLWRKKWLLEHEAKHAGYDKQYSLF
ncbi:bifunctional transcriptional activator/DNA repair enzyme AdaA [Polluticoccus soli]|uniref:bifunctional transcriptional activator/DNA repair enzyme AdaA n=1 Tax=Polluticoccus soli TaxID=3034150 RepID=UPI0023E211AD|nr:methylated-DNA--[protein]-cysteine S-methyltransferase [Flavipsychrobacter sp. JY13-12]